MLVSPLRNLVASLILSATSGAAAPPAPDAAGTFGGTGEWR